MVRIGLNHRFWKLFYFFIILNIITACGTTSTKNIADVKPDEDILRVGVSTNAPPLIYKQGEKIVGLEGYGLQVTGRVPLECEPRPENREYLLTKCQKLGHLMKQIEG